LALALTYLGNAADGNALAHEGLCRARTLGARQLEALFLNALSVIADSRVDRLPSLDMDEQDLLLNRELGNRRHEAIALGNLGSGWLRLGEHTQARHYLEESLRLARAVGDRATQPDALTNLSVLALRQGDEALALTHAQAALDIASAVQSPEFEATALYALGNAELALGHFAPATVIFERAYAVALALDNAAQFDARAGQARVALAQGDTVGAMQAVESLLSQLAGGGTLEGTKAPYLIRLTCHQVLARVGDPRATALLASAHAELMALAATLTDAAPRHNFMNNIPEHRAIVASFSVVQTVNTCS
jgi:tetratricopeptide (TPR) repeat protein